MKQKWGETSKLQWAALVVLVVAIVALLVVLFTQQQDYRTDAEAARESNASAPAPEPSAPETAEPSSSPSATEEPEATEDASSAPVDAATAAARDVVHGSDDAVISVLGDSTSNTSGEWVYRWAEELGNEASVSVHTWNPEAGDWFAQTRDFGEGDRSITVWNASADQGNPGFPLELEDMIPAEADLTVLNYGHWGDPEFVASSLDELLTTLDAGAEGAAPVVLTAQNPALPTWVGYADTNRDAMRAAAEERDLPMIDVFAAFEDTGDWQSLLSDEVNPDDQGHELWANTVSAFFTD